MRCDFIPFFEIAKLPKNLPEMVKLAKMAKFDKVDNLIHHFLDTNNKLNYQTLKYHLCGKKYKKENSYIYYRFGNRSQQNKSLLPFLRICRYEKVVKITKSV